MVNSEIIHFFSFQFYTKMLSLLNCEHGLKATFLATALFSEKSIKRCDNYRERVFY